MVKTITMKLLKDIRFWIFLFFLIRLFGITDAPLEMGHNWRQSLTNMIARNFFEVSPNIFYPRIDMAGANTGIIGSEFPLLSYLIFLISKVFGYNHWYGRLINLIVSSVSIYYFYLIVKKYFNQQIAFNSSIILIVSIWFSFSRKIMPDTFSVSLVIIGLYYCFIYFEKGRFIKLLLFFVFVTTGVLCKIPAIALMSILAIPLFADYPVGRKIVVLITGAISFLIISLWYFYWVPYLVDTYHFKLFFPKGLLEGLIEIVHFPLDTIDKFSFTSFYSYIAFLLFAVGLVMMFIKKQRLLVGILTIVSIVFFAFILKTGSVFSLHNYYIIPYTPLMALIAGYGLTLIKVKWQYIMLLLISIESLANQSYDFRIKNEERYKLSLENSIDGIIGKHDLIIVNGTHSPQTMYFLHRKGWSVENKDLLEPGFISARTIKGAKYLVIDKNRITYSFPFPLVHEDENIKVYTLKE